MEQNLENNSPSAQEPTFHGPSSVRRRNLFMRLPVFVMLLGVSVVIAYSTYIAVHDADSQETIVLGQNKIAAGSPAALRILVRDRVSGKPIQGAEVQLSLRSKAGTFKLGAFRTDAAGSIGDTIPIPDLFPGEYELVLDSKSVSGSDHIVRKVEVHHPARLLLSSDKPIYQPGQTIHLRSLTLNGRSQKPFANVPVTFEIKDPKGNKVFKETRKSSDFGIASVDFVLASELNLGRYEIDVTTGTATAQQAVEVKRYVLPKFKLHIQTEQSYYLPGQTVSGTVHARYFFGRPVSGGTLTLDAATFDEKPAVITNLKGQTDAEGNYSFQFVLPDYFVGLPQNNGQALLNLKAELRDTAQHVENTTLSLSVARNELELTAIPEAGAFVPGVENLLYVLAAYPDGRPAVCKIFVNGTAYQSDKQGVSEVKVVPGDTNQQIDIQAIDTAGRNAKLAYLNTNGTVPAFLLRTDKAVYKTGERRTAKLR